MKRLLYLLVLVILIPFLSIPLFAQILHVAVKDTATNLDVKIKSIRVTNEQQGIDTIYYTSDIDFGYLTSINFSDNTENSNKCQLISSEYAGNVLILKVYSPIAGNSDITISDYLGRKATQLIYNLNDGINIITIPNIANSNIIYFVKISYSTCSNTFKIIPETFNNSLINKLSPNKLITLSPYKLYIKVDGVLNTEDEFTTDLIPPSKDSSILIKCMIPRPGHDFKNISVTLSGFSLKIEKHTESGYYSHPNKSTGTYDLSIDSLTIYQKYLKSLYRIRSSNHMYYYSELFFENINNYARINISVTMDTILNVLDLKYSYWVYIRPPSNNAIVEDVNMVFHFINIPYEILTQSDDSHLLFATSSDDSSLDVGQLKYYYNYSKLDGRIIDAKTDKLISAKLENNFKIFITMSE